MTDREATGSNFSMSKDTGIADSVVSMITSVMLSVLHCNTHLDFHRLLLTYAAVTKGTLESIQSVFKVALGQVNRKST